ncbi:polyubiquitin-like [Diadema antillarum]|uniref:polyubiquitin-like n=1 Tax=Diadema antillarum TaxID=105358 RepID=UPI003A876B52
MINVFLNDGTTDHKISIDRERTVRELRTCVQERTSVRPNEQHLSVDVIEGPNRVRTRVLEACDDTSSLQDCRIVHRSRINMRVANSGTAGRANGRPKTAELVRNTFQVFVQTPGGKIITIDTCSEDTIGVLKRKIQAKTCDAPRQQTLTHAGKPLAKDSATLQHNKIGKQSFIAMNIRLVSG